MERLHGGAVSFWGWLFFESTAHVVRTWFFFLKFILDFFSVPLLVRTFFSPWHRYWFGSPKGFDPAQWLTALFGNLMSRGIGVILRSFFIALGIVFEAFVFIIGFAAVVFWIMLPFTSVYLCYLGFSLVFS
ncbi:hypothetical protein HY250_04445 [Candidatus Azambacteria bacterium]|nr:hypothetical protein [Candidatus Azambacteria bacterium]MBI3685628.1 hypothetical protein [Candidatus Azambacteria bacterium]